jgi:hypothetical protein
MKHLAWLGYDKLGYERLCHISGGLAMLLHFRPACIMLGLVRAG